jgi:hypothetical protein
MLKVLLILIASAMAQDFSETVSGKIIGIDDTSEIAVETSPGKQLLVDIHHAQTGDHIGTPIALERVVIAHGHFQGDRFIAESIHKGQ